MVRIGNRKIFRISQNLRGVVFSGGRELGRAVDDVSEENGPLLCIRNKIKKLLIFSNGDNDR